MTTAMFQGALCHVLRRVRFARNPRAEAYEIRSQDGRTSAIAMAEELTEWQGPKPRILIGFQICDAAGNQIQGDPAVDPTGLTSFEILAPAALPLYAAACGAGFLWMPVFQDDIENPSIVG